MLARSYVNLTASKRPLMRKKILNENASDFKKEFAAKVVKYYGFSASKASYYFKHIVLQVLLQQDLRGRISSQLQLVRKLQVLPLATDDLIYIFYDMTYRTVPFAGPPCVDNSVPLCILQDCSLCWLALYR